MPEGAELTPAERAARRRRLAEVFGDALPEQTADDVADPREGDRSESRETWLKSQVPPHHGDAQA